MQPSALPTVWGKQRRNTDTRYCVLELFLFRKSKGSELPVIFASIFLLRKVISVSMLSPGEVGIVHLLSALKALWSRE